MEKVEEPPGLFTPLPPPYPPHPSQNFPSFKVGEVFELDEDGSGLANGERKLKAGEVLLPDERVE